MVALRTQNQPTEFQTVEVEYCRIFIYFGKVNARSMVSIAPNGTACQQHFQINEISVIVFYLFLFGAAAGINFHFRITREKRTRTTYI